MKKKSVNKNGSMKKDLKAKLAIKYVIVYEVIHYTLEAQSKHMDNINVCNMQRVVKLFFFVHFKYLDLSCVIIKTKPFFCFSFFFIHRHQRYRFLFIKKHRKYSS